MKKLFLTILPMWLISTSFAGSVITDSTFIHHMILNGIQNADYIFEGEVIEVTSYFNEEQNYIFTSNTVFVKQIWKTTEIAEFSEGDYVEIITRGGTVENLTLEISHNIGFTVGQKGMFLCQPTTYYPNPNTTLSEERQLQIHDGLYFDYDYTKGYISTYYSTINFECIDLLYEMLDSSYVAECLQVYPNGILQHLSYQNFMNVSNDKIASATSGTASITYTFENAKTTSSGGKNYFEFDIYISSDQNVYFDNGLVRIEYDTQAFSSNIIANNGLTSQRGTIIASMADYYAPSPGDISANVFAIGIAAEWNAPNRYLCTSTPEQLMHVKMEIKDCTKFPQLKFVDHSIMLSQSFYSSTASGTSLLNFDNIDASDTENSTLCEVSITNMTPTKVNGGTGDIVTITGNLFGSTMGTIQMRNADDGGTSWVDLDDYDITQWTDTEIKVRIPSTLPINVTNPNQYKTPGTGKLRVITQSGSMEETPELEVYYSWRNDIRLNSAKTKIYFAGRDSVYENGIDQKLGYSFVLNPNIANNSQALSCVRKAVDDWVCATEIRWQISNNVAVLPDKYDTISSIRFGQTAQSNVLGETSVWHDVCDDISNNPLPFNPDIDITISNASNHIWFYDSTGLVNQDAGKYDFYSVILHELGHGHLLKHVNDHNDLMFWESDFHPTQNIPWQNRKTFFSSANLDGGIEIVEQSALVNFSNCNKNDHPMAPLEKSNCSVSMFTDRMQKKNFNQEFNAYPNPFSEYATISFELKTDEKAEIKVYNSLGRIVHASPPTSYSAGNQNYVIDGSNLPEGFYIVTVKIGHEIVPIKLLKQ